ncbi:MAG: hypothetical protein QHI48_11985, partial [Bacteroidota bacterium]|nr:hypothetical protein [Bacteroidota bacterium]
MRNTAARKRSVVRVAAVSYLVGGEPHTPERNERLCTAYVEEAEERRADIVCFPEYVTGAGMVRPVTEATEQETRHWDAFFSDLARKHRMN